MLLLLLVSVVQSSAELPPSPLLGPRRFPHHALQYLQEVSPEPTKQGPVLFPNDAPPPPRPPLVVTSRPISESIARSDLNPDLNNSIAEPSQVDADYVRPSFRLKPEYLRKLKPKNFLRKPKQFNGLSLPTAGPVPEPLDVESYPALLLSRSAAVRAIDNYGYDKHADIPPIYKALGDHVLKQHSHYDVPPIYRIINDHVKQNPSVFAAKGSPISSRIENFQRKEPKTSNKYHHHDVPDEGDYDHDSNYAFSYRVKDKKTGDDFSHSQQSTGSATNGEYRVRLPDGRMQIVSYTADENGYKADVRYDEDYEIANRIDVDRVYNNNKLNSQNYYKHVPTNNDNYNNYGLDTNKESDIKTFLHSKNINNHAHAHAKFNLKQNTPEPKQTFTYKTIPNVQTTQRYDDFDYPSREIEDYRVNYNYDLPKKQYDYYNFNPNYYESFIHDENKREESKPVREDFYDDASKELEGDDYSVEHDGKSNDYGNSKSKFNQILPKNDLGTIVVPNIQNEVSSTTLKPSYEELRALFVKSTPNPANIYKNVEINVPSTTPNNFIYDDGTTEHVVVIAEQKPTFYTKVTTTAAPVTVTPIPATPIPATSLVNLTPQNYLVSTIAHLKNGQKPVLSDSFISRINKYLSFK